MYIVGKNQIYLHLLQNSPENLTNGTFSTDF
jgi:hypothetical protein